MLTARIIITVLISLMWSVYAYAIDVKLQWNPNPESDIAGYKVYYGVNDLSNPTHLDVSNQTFAATISGLDPALNYSFAIAAYNTSGLEAPYSNIVTALESVTPTVSITSPVNNAQVINTVSISANASDNVAVTKVEYYVDGILKYTDTSSPYQYAWDTSTIAAGIHTITAKAYDAAGNVGASSISVSVVKDVTPPTIASIAPASGSIVSGIVNVSCTATDDVGVTMVEYYVNGAIQAAVNSTPYKYNWDTKTASDGSYILTAKAYDAASNVTTSSTVTVTVKNTVSDTTVPVVSAFTLPATSTFLTVAVSSFTASDAVGVTGYIITESATAPSSVAAGWTASAPTSFTFSAAGLKTAYAWAKDAAGNVSASRSAVVNISSPDTTAPVISTFTMPTTATSLSVTVSSFTASDTVGIAGYKITESATAPAATAAGWTTSSPTSYTFSAAGSKTAYAWAKDAAGNVSASRSAAVTISIPLTDTTAPVISTFTMPSTASSLTVAVSSFSASDAVGITGYKITESSTAPAASAAGWSNSAPTSFTFSTAGLKTAYAWTKDAAGNVSSPRALFVIITLSTDTTAPVISAFTMPATATTLSIPISSLTATDAIGVTGYMITENAAVPAAGAAGWTTSAPTSFTFSAVGSKTAYAWAKDAAGNVSASRSASVTITLPVAAVDNLTINDALTTLQIVVGKVQPTNDQKARLDVAPIINGISKPDGKIDISDVIVILGKVTGKVVL